MGNVLNNPEEAQKMNQIKENYTVLKSINDPRYGEGKILEPKKRGTQVLMKEINLTDEIQFKKWQKKLDARKTTQNENVIQIIQTHTQKETQMCSQMYKVYILFEYIPDSLQVRINLKKIENSHFSQDEMMTLISCAINHNISHQNIRTHTLSVSGSAEHHDLTLKICDTPLLTSMTAFGAVLQDYSGNLKGYYLSPILVKAVFTSNYQPSHNAYKSDVFSLGMSLLSTALLQPCDICYLYNVGEINEHEVKTMLDQAQSLYSKTLVDILRDMLSFKEEDRPDFLMLGDYIQGRQQNESKDSIKITSRVNELQMDHEDDQQPQDQNGLNHFTSASPFQDEKYPTYQNNDTFNKGPSKTMQMDIPIYLERDNVDQLKSTQYPSEMTSKISINDIIQGQITNKNNETQQISRINTSKIDTIHNSPAESKKDYPRPQAYKSHLSDSNIYKPEPKKYEPINNRPLDVPPIKYQANSQFQSQFQSQYQSQEVDLIAQYEAKYKTKILSSQAEPFASKQYKQADYESAYMPLVKSNDPYKFDNQFNYQERKDTQQSFQQSKRIDNFYQYQMKETKDIPQHTYSQSTQDYLQQTHKTYEPQSQLYPPRQNNENIYSQEQTNSYNPRTLESIRQSYHPEYQSQNNNTDQYKVNQLLGQRQSIGKSGYARLDFPQGGYYEGNLRDNKMYGFGTLYYTSGVPAYEGQWFDNKFQGQGTLYNEAPDNDQSMIDHRDLESIGNLWKKYVGEFSDDNKNGFGTLYFTNGDKFEGSFKNDQIHGAGTYMRNHGQIIKGIWQNNVLRQ